MNAQARDSLELASLASSTHITSNRSSESSSRAPSSRRLSFSDEDPLHDSNTRGQRSYSVSSAFDFASNFFPLAATNDGGYAALGQTGAVDGTNTRGGNLEKHKTLEYFSGVALVVGSIIGSGIFSTPGQVNKNVGSPGASLLVWFLAGILAWTGAASYIELAGAIPLNGGSQVYLSKIFGEWAGFLFTWTSVCVLIPGSSAMIAVICGEYLARVFIGADGHVSPWLYKGIALVALIAVTLLNSISTKLGIRFAKFFILIKFIALLGVFITGIVVAATGYAWHGDASQSWKSKEYWTTGTSHDLSQWAVALYAGLWSFDGWGTVNFVTGEFKNPARDIPKVIHSSLVIVIISYLVTNVAYFLVLPANIINNTNTIAVAFGQQVFGTIGAVLLALTVSGSSFGALNASTFTSGRLVYAAAKEGYAPGIFGTLGIGKNFGQDNVRLDSITERSQRNLFSRWFGDDDAGVFYTPITAMLLMAVLTTGYIIVGEFATLLTFAGVAGYTFYFFTVLGLIVLRVREPNLERPYKTWITTPIIFCCVSLFLLSRAIFAKPEQSLIVIGFVSSGVPVYWLGVKRNRTKEGEKLKSWKFWERWQ